MKIISHRGYWKQTTEKNKPVAFERSFNLCFGTETDLRDRYSEIVISHDMADDDAIMLTSLLNIHQSINADLMLALNIKADGLQLKLKKTIDEYSLKNYFVFDMSIPDSIGYINNEITFFSRQSEYEPKPAFYDQCSGIWLDAFCGNWYDSSIIINHVKQGKQVALVSPDLHKRKVDSLWEQLLKDKIHNIDEVILCTDIPEEATNFFK